MGEGEKSRLSGWVKDVPRGAWFLCLVLAVLSGSGGSFRVGWYQSFASSQ